MAWCEENGVAYVFGLAKNERLVAKIASELGAAEEEIATTGAPARRFTGFMWRTPDSWRKCCGHFRTCSSSLPTAALSES